MDTGGVAGGLRDASQAIGGTAVQVLNSNRGRKYLLISNNDSGTDNIHVRIGVGYIGGVDQGVTAAVVNAAGTVKIVPGGSLIFEGGWVPSGAVSIIADASATPVTVYEGL